MISVKNVIKQYGNLRVLNDVSLQIQQGEFVSITGPSGAGKSTLLHLMGTLDTPDSGAIYFNDIDTTTLSKKKIALLRNSDIGFVFQFHHLLPEFSVLENILIPAMIKGTKISDAKNKASTLLMELGIENIQHKKPSETSGGEAQRAAIARALINSPKVLFADEPTGNLDTANSQSVFNLLLDIRKKYALTLIMVTHNNDLASQSDRIIKMKDGKIVH